MHTMWGFLVILLFWDPVESATAAPLSSCRCKLCFLILLVLDADHWRSLKIVLQGVLGEGECKVKTILENIVTKLKAQENVRIVSSEGKRHIAISGIKYGDENWSTIAEWAAQSLSEHVVNVITTPNRNTIGSEHRLISGLSI